MELTAGARLVDVQWMLSVGVSGSRCGRAVTDYRLAHRTVPIWASRKYEAGTSDVCFHRSCMLQQVP
jgi:hypothetical protein